MNKKLKDILDRVKFNFEDIEEEYNEAVKSFVLIAPNLSNSECQCSASEWMYNNNILLLLNKQHILIQNFISKIEDFDNFIKDFIFKKEILEKVNDMYLEKFQYLKNVKNQDLRTLVEISEVSLPNTEFENIDKKQTINKINHSSFEGMSMNNSDRITKMKNGEFILIKRNGLLKLVEPIEDCGDKEKYNFTFRSEKLILDKTLEPEKENEEKKLLKINNESFSIFKILKIEINFEQNNYLSSPRNNISGNQNFQTYQAIANQNKKNSPNNKKKPSQSPNFMNNINNLISPLSTRKIIKPTKKMSSKSIKEISNEKSKKKDNKEKKTKNIDEALRSINKETKSSMNKKSSLNKTFSKDMSKDLKDLKNLKKSSEKIETSRSKNKLELIKNENRTRNNDNYSSHQVKLNDVILTKIDESDQQTLKSEQSTIKSKQIGNNSNSIMNLGNKIDKDKIEKQSKIEKNEKTDKSNKFEKIEIDKGNYSKISPLSKTNINFTKGNLSNLSPSFKGQQKINFNNKVNLNNLNNLDNKEEYNLRKKKLSSKNLPITDLSELIDVEKKENELDKEFNAMINSFNNEKSDNFESFDFCQDNSENYFNLRESIPTKNINKESNFNENYQKKQISKSNNPINLYIKDNQIEDKNFITISNIDYIETEPEPKESKYIYTSGKKHKDSKYIYKRMNTSDSNENEEDKVKLSSKADSISTNEYNNLANIKVTDSPIYKSNINFKISTYAPRDSINNKLPVKNKNSIDGFIPIDRLISLKNEKKEEKNERKSTPDSQLINNFNNFNSENNKINRIMALPNMNRTSFGNLVNFVNPDQASDKIIYKKGKIPKNEINEKEQPSNSNSIFAQISDRYKKQDKVKHYSLKESHYDQNIIDYYDRKLQNITGSSNGVYISNLNYTNYNTYTNVNDLNFDKSKIKGLNTSQSGSGSSKLYLFNKK